MSVESEAPDMVTIPRREYEALKAELRQYRRKEGDRIALERIKADPGPGHHEHSYTREQLTEMWGIVD